MKEYVWLCAAKPHGDLRRDLCWAELRDWALPSLDSGHRRSRGPFSSAVEVLHSYDAAGSTQNVIPWFSMLSECIQLFVDCILQNILWTRQMLGTPINNPAAFLVHSWCHECGRCLPEEVIPNYPAGKFSRQNSYTSFRHAVDFFPLLTGSILVTLWPHPTSQTAKLLLPQILEMWGFGNPKVQRMLHGEMHITEIIWGKCKVLLWSLSAYPRHQARIYTMGKHDIDIAALLLEHKAPQKWWKSNWCIPLTATCSKRLKIGALWYESWFFWGFDHPNDIIVKIDGWKYLCPKHEVIHFPFLPW